MLKEKIKKGERTVGMHINLNDVASARIAALAGYDFIWIDLEHSYLSLENLMSYICVIKAAGTPVVVRVPQNDFTYTKKVLEMGVDGIVFPMVKSAEEADRLISWTLYPPYGVRGFGPMGAVDFGFKDVLEYVGDPVSNLCRFIQIEHVDAVDDLDRIMNNDYIDGYIFGPNDLSGSINELCNVFGENTTALIRKSIKMLKGAGKYIGVSTGDISVKTLEYWRDMGIDMISAGADFDHLKRLAKQTCFALKRVMGSRELYEKKIYYTGNNLTKDTECSLVPPSVFGKEAAESDAYSAKKRKWQSAPCICKIGENDLLCTFSGDNFGGDEQPNNYNVIMRSRNGGESWETVLVIDHMDSVRMHEPILWKDSKGRIWLFWAQSYDWWDGRGGVWSMFIEVQGDRISHGKPNRICSGVLATPPITLSDGRILLPVSIWKRWKDRIHDYPLFGNSAVYISDEKGETFTYVGGASAKDSTFDENAVVQRSDNSLYMIIRCENYIAYTESFDMGKTWTEPKKLMDHTSSRSYIARLGEGFYILVTNNDNKKRRNMTVFTSHDECKTWSFALLLDSREAVSYPAGCVDENGRAFVAWDYNRYTDEEVLFTSFDKDDILSGRAADVKIVSIGENGRKTKKTHETGENN